MMAKKQHTREWYEGQRDDALREYFETVEQKRRRLFNQSAHQDAVNRIALENGDKVLPYPGVIEMAGCGDVWGDAR